MANQRPIGLSLPERKRELELLRILACQQMLQHFLLLRGKLARLFRATVTLLLLQRLFTPFFHALFKSQTETQLTPTISAFFPFSAVFEKPDGKIPVMLLNLSREGSCVLFSHRRIILNLRLFNHRINNIATSNILKLSAS